jgi:apolipoprotein N-acyltransferase
MKTRPWLPGLASGLMLGLTSIAHGPLGHFQPLIFVGWLPLWLYARGESCTRRIVLAGWLCQVALTFVDFHWIAYTVNEFSHMGLALSVLVMLLYCAVGNLQFPVALFAWTRLVRPAERRSFGALLLLAILCAAFERFGTAVFHWNFGYHWLYLGLPGAQLTDVTGFRWLCTLSICLNIFPLLAWERRSWRPLVPGLAIFALVNALGFWRLSVLTPPDAVARVLLIQPNESNREKERLDHDKGFREEELARQMALTDRALKSLTAPPDFAVWPENAFPGYIADIPLSFGLTPRLKEFLRSRHLNLVTGGFGFNLKEQTTNGMFALVNTGLWSPPAYEKRILLPFGEYVPGSSRFPALKKWFPDVRDYGAGEGPVTLRLGDFRLGGQICYEGLFDFIARDLANAGAQLIVNITNDSWYGDWQEPWQQGKDVQADRERAQPAEARYVGELGSG